jgi:large subunit ribosomal protein L4
MLEAQLYTATAQRKGRYVLPPEFDGVVREGPLYYAVRAYLGNQRQGTHAAKTRAEVSGGNQKPWRQKGTGRARQGSTRAPHWVGGGIVFGPKPRSYRTALPRKVRRLARRSALNARAAAGAIHVVEGFDFPSPKTRQLAELLAGLGLADRTVLVLTAEHHPNLYLSGRNLPGVHVMRYRDATAYDLLWAQALVIEQAAIAGGVAEETAPAPARRKGPAGKRAAGRAAGKARAKATRAAARGGKAATKRPGKPAARKGGRGKKGGGDD